MQMAAYMSHIGNGTSNYDYTFKTCYNIYKTQDGKVYVLNNDNYTWEPSEYTHYYLVKTAGYMTIDEATVSKLIEELKEINTKRN